MVKRRGLENFDPPEGTGVQFRNVFPFDLKGNKGVEI